MKASFSHDTRAHENTSRAEERLVLRSYRPEIDSACCTRRPEINEYVHAKSSSLIKVRRILTASEIIVAELNAKKTRFNDDHSTGISFA